MKERLKELWVGVKKVAKAVSARSWKEMKAALQYIRVNDEKNRVSLTNIAMIIVMVKMCVTPATSWQDMTALAIAILGYQAKRVIEGKKNDDQ